MALPLRFGYNRQKKSARFVLAFFFEKSKKPKIPSVHKLKTIADKGWKNGLVRDRQYKNKGFYLVTIFFGFWMHKPWIFWLFGFCADKALYTNTEKKPSIWFSLAFSDKEKGSPATGCPLFRLRMFSRRSRSPAPRPGCKRLRPRWGGFPAPCKALRVWPGFLPV